MRRMPKVFASSTQPPSMAWLTCAEHFCKLVQMQMQPTNMAKPPFSSRHCLNHSLLPVGSEFRGKFMIRQSHMLHMSTDTTSA